MRFDGESLAYYNNDKVKVGGGERGRSALANSSLRLSRSHFLIAVSIIMSLLV